MLGEQRSWVRTLRRYRLDTNALVTLAVFGFRRIADRATIAVTELV